MFGRSQLPAVVILLACTTFSGSTYRTCSAEDEQEPQRTTRKTPAGHSGPGCIGVDTFFADEVWPKVGERTCLKCHNANGDAAESSFLLRDSTVDGKTRHDAVNHNASAFQRMAMLQEDGKSRLLQKALGQLDHGGGAVVKADSTASRILSRFVRRATAHPDDTPSMAAYDAPPFFEGLEMISPKRLLRRVTLSLAGRLPTSEEQSIIDDGGLPAIDTVLDGVMAEDAFYERLQEAFNDILLIQGYDGSGEDALSYDHFEKTRHWYKSRDPGKLSYKHPEKRAYYKLVNDYREAMRREPLELIAYIVRHDRPFTEIVTADYIMVSPYTSRGYGIFDELADSFDDPEDPFQFVPAKINALKSRNGKVQESPTGLYPHAGLLSSFQYLKRYPTTESNRNRLRVRMYFQHFLGVDIMALAPRVNDAAAITAKYEVPTMQAADCVVCHKVIDPVAGLYQDYYVVDGKGVYGPRKDGWFKDMFPPGLQGEDFLPEHRWRSLQWLGELTARDPRFAVAMVEHVWYILMGRKPILPPEDIDDPMFAAKRRAYRVQRDEIERTAARLAESDFNLKTAFRELIRSKFYRVDGLATASINPRRQAELDDIGVVRLLTPEQLERKIRAVFGREWGRLIDRESKLKILYGGIDSKEVTERNPDPGGAMGAIQRIMANDVACQHIATDFSLPANERTLFPNVELSVVPGKTPEADNQIRQAVVHLHHRILGREDQGGSPEVERTCRLFAGIIEDANANAGFDKRGSYWCGRVNDQRLDDPNYTLRAWRGVVTYLLRQHEFLYE